MIQERGRPCRQHYEALRIRFFTLGVTTAVAIFAATTTAHAGNTCANADLQPTDVTQTAAAEIATRCLVNRERRRRHRRPMRYNDNLFQSSTWQAQDMVAYAYFDHQREGGPGFAGRITRFGYSKNARGYTLGENLAWGGGGGASPREIVAMWMQSPGHRANMLSRTFREQAVAAVLVNGDEIGGDYAGAGPLVIYVNQFGRRF